MRNRILDAVAGPQALHVLTDEELAILAAEIREEILLTTSRTGGHLGSSLGAVEIILAVHSLISSPHDHFVFDVGHQAYAHKLVTGRLDAFSSLRQLDGISGFTRTHESPHDKHPSGHASDSLSVAAGLAKARDISGGDQKVVALIGDAALSGGMAFEALNHIGQDQTDMVIILNDNTMSISPNVGALVNHLSDLRASNEYRTTRDKVQERLEQSGALGQSIVDWGRTAKESFKQFIVPETMVFEQLNILCTAPVDGHNISALRHAIAQALAVKGPVLVHVVTQKGHGYLPAERDPESFHGVGPFELSTGKSLKTSQGKSYTQVFSDALLDEAEKDKRICAITAAMKGGTGLDAFAQAYPTRCFDVGIAEEHATAFASGLAQGGLKPVVAIYSTFEQRAFDQIVIDTALPDHSVVFALDRAGLVGDDGSTHHGIFDIAYMRMIPHMHMLAPSNEAELVHALHTALGLDGPVAIRYPRGTGTGASLPEQPCSWQPGLSRQVRPGKDVALLAFGRMVQESLVAAELLHKEGIEARVVDMRWVKPFDKAAVQAALDTRLVLTLEEGVIDGGVGQAISAFAAQQASKTPVINLGIEDSFVEQGSVAELFEFTGLDGASIAKRVLSALESQAV